MSFYFEKYKNRQPPAPLPHRRALEWTFRVLAVAMLLLGLRYLTWRWLHSLNSDALWFAIPLVLAETGAFVGLALFVFNLWKVADTPPQPAPASLGDCSDLHGSDDRPLAVDVYIATYNEDPELVRLSIRDARALRYPHPLELNIYVLDDGRRAAMREIAEAEGVHYLSRSNNIGYKAGNLRNALEHTGGDFLVICDADTRLFPSFLENTLGYFRDPRVAWVQTPQWFYDLPEGETLQQWAGRHFGRVGAGLGKAVERLSGRWTIGADPFCNDPTMFYDVLMRRRNWANASFCCGAASVHRREAVMEAALRAWSGQVERDLAKRLTAVRKLTGERRGTLDALVESHVRGAVALDTELTPYKFHVSEDIFTSIVLHSDRERGWKSVLHPRIEARMLSPQDLLAWTVQRFKYAGGSLDIAVHENPIFRPGLRLPQRLMYAATFWSYLGGVWNIVFLLAPVVFMLSGVTPVRAYGEDFYAHLLPFLLCAETAMALGTWGVGALKSRAWYIAFFPINLRALWTVLRGQRIHFPTTPKDRQAGTFGHLVRPQIAVVLLTLMATLYGAWQYLQGAAGMTLEALLINGGWGLFNVYALSGMIRSAYWQPPDEA